MKRLLWMGCLAYLLIGLAHVVVGSIMPNLLEHYGKDYSAGGTLIFAQFAGFLLGVLVSPLLLRKFGKRKGLLIATTMLCAAELCYAFLPPWEWMYAIGAVAGFGFGMIEAVIGTLILVAVTEGTAIAMSRLEVFFGGGALLMPLIAGWLIREEVWRFSFLLVTFLALVLLLVCGKGNFKELNAVLDAREEGTRSQGSLLRTYPGQRGWHLVIFIAFFFLYVGTEMSFVNFLPSLMIEKAGTDKATAALSVTVFWIAMTAGRLFAGVIAEKISYSRYVIMCCLGSFLMISLFALVQGLTVLMVFIVLLGLFMSGLFSIALVFANKLLPGAEEMTPSLLIASGGVGGAFLPLWMGKSMDWGGAGASSWLLSAFVAALVLFSIAAVVVKKTGTVTESAR